MNPPPTPSPIARHPEILCVGRKNLPRLSAEGEEDGRGEIGREHLDVILYEDGSIDLVDRASANGTFLLKGDTWVELERPVAVGKDSRIRLGSTYETEVEGLVSAARGNTGNRMPEQTNVVNRASSPSGGTRWVRNPNTGQPEKK